MFGLKKSRLSDLGEKIRFGAGIAFILGMFAIAMALQSRKEQKEPLSVPPLTAQVMDQTGTLDAAALQQLQNKLATLERSQGSQVVVLMVSSTQPEDIAEYANRVADTWKLGRRVEGDGLLIVVAKNDRRMRIEVSRALEGTITDIEASRIIERDMAPHFKAGRYAQGLLSATDSIAAKISGGTLPPAHMPEAMASSPPSAASAAPMASSPVKTASSASGKAGEAPANLESIIIVAMTLAATAAAFATWREEKGKKTRFWILLLPTSVLLIILASNWLFASDAAGHAGSGTAVFLCCYPLGKLLWRGCVAVWQGIKYGSGGGSGSGGSSSGGRSSGSSSGGGYSSGGGGSYGGGGASGGW